MKKLHKKIELLKKKKDRFGLTEKEQKELNKLNKEFFSLHEEILENHINMTVIPLLMTKEINNALKEIQDIVPWNGNILTRDQEIEQIAEYEKKLSVEEKELIRKKLEYIHICMLQRFENFCSTETGWNYMCEVSKAFTSDPNGDIMEVLIRLDARYREFGELFGIHLQEVEVYFDEEGG